MLSNKKSTAQRAAEYVEEHIFERMSSGTIAESMKLNAGYLNTSFKKATGVTLTQYIHSKKIERAKKMLTQTDESITDICADLGYFDQSHFYRRFKAETGVTPKKYRKNLGQ